MSDKTLLSLSSFEWASVSQYIIYISSVAGLTEVNTNEVICFPLARFGPHKMIARKEKVLAVLRENRAKLERFAARKQQELGEEEMSVLRSIYRQFSGSIDTVEGHLIVAKAYQDELDVGLFNEEIGGGDDELF